MSRVNIRPLVLTFVDTHSEKGESDILDLIFSAIYLASDKEVE